MRVNIPGLTEPAQSQAQNFNVLKEAADRFEQRKRGNKENQYRVLARRLVADWRLKNEKHGLELDSDSRN